MATVAKSEYLFHEIRKKITSMFEAKLKEAHSNYGIPEIEAGDMIYNLVISAESQKLMNEVADNEELTIRTYDGTAQSSVFNYKDNIHLSYRDESGSRESISIKMSRPRYVPHSLDQYGNGYVLSLEQRLQKNILSGENYDKIMALINTRQENVKKISLKQNALLDSFSELWKQAASVNQLVKIWPAAYQLLEGLKTANGVLVTQRLAEKSDKNTVKKIQESVDTNALNAQLLVAKIIT